MKSRDARRGGNGHSRVPLSCLSPTSHKAAMRRRRQQLWRANARLLRHVRKPDQLVDLSPEQSDDVLESIESILEDPGQSKILETAVSEGLYDAIGDGLEAPEETVAMLLAHTRAEASAARKQKEEDRQWVDDQVTGGQGRRWSAATLRFVLAVWAKCPAAYRTVKSFGHLNLPSEHTLPPFIDAVKQPDGIDGTMLDLHLRTLGKAIEAEPHADIAWYDAGLYLDEGKLSLHIVPRAPANE